jgi:hypothetical protein
VVEDRPYTHLRADGSVGRGFTTVSVYYCTEHAVMVRYANGLIDKRTMEAERAELRLDRDARQAAEDRDDAYIGEPIDLAGWCA